MAQEFPSLSALKFFRAVCEGESPEGLAVLLKALETKEGSDLFALANAIGALEPLAFTRPRAGDIVEVFDKIVTVPAATLQADGVTVTPTDGMLCRICCPEGKVLMIDKLRAEPGDLTAMNFGSVVMKRMAVMGFSESFCPAAEPAEGDEQGTFNNIEHVVLVPSAGFDLYGRNNSPYGPATFTVHAKMWPTC